MLAARDTDTEVAPETATEQALFHRLNNQLGIVLANAELLEARLAEPGHRARAGQVIEGALQAMATVRELRGRLVG
jgi:hypothetical protein